MSVNLLHDRKRDGWCLIAALSVVLVLAPAAVAGSLSVDGNALSGWCGTQSYEGTYWGLDGPVYFHANVDYAVYAPSMLEQSFPGMDPSGGEQYVYAYQIDYDVSSTTVDDVDLALLTVGLDGDAYEQVDNLGNFASDVADVAPTSMTSLESLVEPPTSVVWNFDHDPAQLVPFSQSDILIFTSPAPPEWDFASLQGVNNAYIDTAQLPSPSVPEPASLMLLVIAMSAVTLYRLPR